MQARNGIEATTSELGIRTQFLRSESNLENRPPIKFAPQHCHRSRVGIEPDEASLISGKVESPWIGTGDSIEWLAVPDFSLGFYATRVSRMDLSFYRVPSHVCWVELRVGLLKGCIFLTDLTVLGELFECVF